MTPEHHDHDDAHVTLLDAGAAAERRQYLAPDDPGGDRGARTPQQKRMDQTFTDAEDGAAAALESAEDSLAWMETMGDVPSQFRNMPVLLTQWKAWIAEQKRIKG